MYRIVRDLTRLAILFILLFLLVWSLRSPIGWSALPEILRKTTVAIFIDAPFTFYRKM